MLARLYAGTIWLTRRVCELLLVGMVVLIATEVLARQLFQHSLQLTDEVAGYLLVAVAFLGMGVSLHDKALFRVEFVQARLAGRPQRLLQIGFDLVALGVGIVLEHQLIRLVVSSYTRGFREATLLATPLYLPQIVMPVGVGLMIAVLLAQIAVGLRDLVGGGANDAEVAR
jgi:TRAP-type C4-dicarboxylate transport system permease small subunit